jgi:hypothetical protein
MSYIQRPLPIKTLSTLHGSGVPARVLAAQRYPENRLYPQVKGESLLGDLQCDKNQQ